MAKISYEHAIATIGAKVWVCAYNYYNIEHHTPDRNQPPVECVCVQMNAYYNALHTCNKNGTASKKRVRQSHTYLFDSEYECRAQYVSLIEATIRDVDRHIASSVKGFENKKTSLANIIAEQGPKK